MNDALKNFKKLAEKVKKPKFLVAAGILGIALLFLSSVLPADKKTDSAEKGISGEEYREQITKSVKQIVKSISGDSSPTVVVTLESGVRYTYADSGESDTVSTSGSAAKESRSSKRSYVTVKDASGGEKALVITENMPEIRGVAVICRGGETEETAESIKNAVTAALNITSKRVFVSGGTY